MNSIAYLLGHWSKRMRARISYSSFGKIKSEYSLNSATQVLVRLEKKDVRIIYEIVPLNYDQEEDIFFLNFTEKKYIFDQNKKEFYRLKPQLKGILIGEL